MKQELTIGILLLLIAVGALIYFLVNYNQGRPVQMVPIINTNNTNQAAVMEKKVTLNKSTIAKHNSAADCWLIIDNKVYDMTNYLVAHPGGVGTVISWCGADATQAFVTKDGRGSHSNQAYNLLNQFYLGNLNAVINQ
ncbi:MAG: cytochrome b5 domain-containing protein [Candidatus Komeilibacteria bacterium]